MSSAYRPDARHWRARSRWPAAHRLTRINRGRAYYTKAATVGDYVFVDYLRNRRRRVR